LTTGKTKQESRPWSCAVRNQIAPSTEKSSTAAARANLAGKISEDEMNSAEQKTGRKTRGEQVLRWRTAPEPGLRVKSARRKPKPEQLPWRENQRSKLGNRKMTAGKSKHGSGKSAPEQTGKHAMTGRNRTEGRHRPGARMPMG
jgi:hypothetical protein